MIVKDLILVVALVMIPALFVSWFVLWALVRHRIRTKHAELWHQLGEPPFLSSGTRTTFALFRFLFSGGLDRPDDKRLQTFRFLMQVAFGLYLLAFGALFWSIESE